MSRRRHSNAHGFSIYRGLPTQARRIQTLLFGQWLMLHHGATPLHTTNEYEVARWRRADGTVCIIYKKANGEVTWTIPAAEDYRAFLAVMAQAKRRG
jgi:hypothetical protein